MHPLRYLDRQEESIPLLLSTPRQIQNRDSEQDFDSKPVCVDCFNRVWRPLKDFWRVSRRYSIVASEVSLLCLNILFFICQADKKIPRKVNEVTLTLLSMIGVISLHYTLDLLFKTYQDTKFCIKMDHYPLASISSLKMLQQASGVALTCSSLIASIFGTIGKENEQAKIYRDVTIWGEMSIVLGTALTVASLVVTYRTLKRIELEAYSNDPSFSANIRFCMDKDTLWHLIDHIKQQDLIDRNVIGDDLVNDRGSDRGNNGLYDNPMESSMRIVKKNIETQLKVTFGGTLALIVMGDALQVVEKIYTPNSLVSAVINCGVSTAYAINIVVEKWMEYRQRERLDRLAM